MYAALNIEHFNLKPVISKDTLKRLGIIDAVYGISALVVLTCGILMWLSVGKPKEFYSKNMLFHIKMTLFFITGILSIIPTIFLIKNRKTDKEEIEVPKKIIMIIRIELLIFITIPILAVLMARGIGR